MITNYFVFVSSDMELRNGSIKPASEIAHYRIDRKCWPIYAGTKNQRQLAKNSKCLIYIAGEKTNKQCFIASAVIKDIKKWNSDYGSFNPQEVISNNPSLVVELKNVNQFKPVSIRPLLEQLSFIDLKWHSWGWAFRGGCRLISSDDYALITNSAGS